MFGGGPGQGGSGGILVANPILLESGLSWRWRWRNVLNLGSRQCAAAAAAAGEVEEVLVRSTYKLVSTMTG